MELHLVFLSFRMGWVEDYECLDSLQNSHPRSFFGLRSLEFQINVRG